MKKSKPILVAATLLSIVVQSFVTGTIIYYAVDIFALYSENQFTGRMRSFDIEYWNAVLGSAFIFVPMLLIKSINRAAKKIAIDRAYEDMGDEVKEEILEMLKARPATSAGSIGEDIWAAPKNTKHIK